jgi:hypothetical protein
VISLAPGAKVFLACRPVDLRNGFDGLTAKAQQLIGVDPFSGHLFIFRGKRGHYFKGLYRDRTGMWLIATRLDGEQTASIYTIIQTAKLNGVNPEGYLRDTLTKIADGHPINRVDDLMPWN